MESQYEVYVHNYVYTAVGCVMRQSGCLHSEWAFPGQQLFPLSPVVHATV